MNNSMLILSIVIICSLAGWYVVLTKYAELKAMLKIREQQEQKKMKAASLKTTFSEEAIVNSTPLHAEVDYSQLSNGHIPGMGPPPVVDLPFDITPEFLQQLQYNQAHKQNNNIQQEPAMEKLNKTNNSSVELELQRRNVCNWASIMHLSGFCLLSGIPFLNIIVPTILWLLKKEQHPYFDKQGREIINFQITLSLMLFLCLGLGIVFVWLLPNAAASLFNWTRTIRVLFSTSMWLPVNLFTCVPFLWGCTLMLRGAVAAYHGVAFKYPYAQQFFLHANSAMSKPQAASQPPRKEKQAVRKVNFG